MATLNNIQKSNWHPILLTIILLFFLTSCKKFVDIPPPSTQLVSVSVFSNNSTATSAVVTIYAQMWQNEESWNMSNDLGLYSDELTSSSTDNTQISLYTNSLIPSSSTDINWGYYYNYIYEANAVISGLHTSTNISPAVKKQLLGEATFIRAFCLFYLTNVYGDIPLVLTSNYTTNGAIASTPRIQVLNQIVNDLKNAQSLLNNNYVDQTDTATTTERVRPTKAAATALLARTYLYMGGFTKTESYYIKADSAATAVIKNASYNLSALNDVFLANSSEAIFQLQTVQPNPYIYSADGENFILTGDPSSGNTHSATISPQLFNSFEKGDQRKINWIGSYNDGSTTWYFPYKYKNDGNITNTGSNEYTMVLRLGEQYLIRAESRVHENSLSAAAADLNMIRNRAGLANTDAVTAADLSVAILQERRVELFTEWGHRWFDLVRTNNANSIMGSPGNVCQFKGGIWSSYKLLFPIIQSDIIKDPNLKQNPGY